MNNSIKISFVIALCSMHVIQSAKPTKNPNGHTTEQEYESDLEQEFADLNTMGFDAFLKRDHARRLRSLALNNPEILQELNELENLSFEDFLRLEHARHLRRLACNNPEILQELDEIERQHQQDQAAAEQRQAQLEQIEQSVPQRQHIGNAQQQLTAQEKKSQEKYEQKQTIIKKIISGKPLTTQEEAAFVTIFSVEEQLYLLELQNAQKPTSTPSATRCLYPTAEELNNELPGYGDKEDFARPEPQPTQKIEYPWHHFHALQSDADMLEMEKREEEIKIKNFFINYLTDINNKNIDRKHLIHKKAGYHIIHEPVLKRQNYSTQEIQVIKNYLPNLDDAEYHTLLGLAFMKNRSLEGILRDYYQATRSLDTNRDTAADIVTFYLRTYPQATDYSRYNAFNDHLRRQEQEAHELFSAW